LVLDPVPDVGDADGETTGADAVAVTVTDVVAGAAVVVSGAAEVVSGAAVVAGAEVVSGADVVSVAVGPSGAVAVRVGVGKLLMMLLPVLPQPTARNATTRTTADRESLFAGCRMPILRVVPGKPPSWSRGRGYAGLIR